MRGFVPILFLAALLIGGGVYFHTHPQIDLAVSRHFFDAASGRFSPANAGFFIAVKHAVYRFDDIWVAVLLLGVIFRPRYRMACIYLALTMAIGPGLLVSLAKEHYPRPRPVEIVQFGGDQPFVAAATYTHEAGQGSLSGHAATGFYLVALAYVVRRRKVLIYVGGLLAGCAISYTRLALGAHFLSDIFFSAVLTLAVAHALALLFARRLERAS